MQCILLFLLNPSNMATGEHAEASVYSQSHLSCRLVPTNIHNSGRSDGETYNAVLMQSVFNKTTSILSAQFEAHAASGNCMQPLQLMFKGKVRVVFKSHQTHPPTPLAQSTIGMLRSHDSIISPAKLQSAMSSTFAVDAIGDPGFFVLHKVEHITLYPDLCRQDSQGGLECHVSNSDVNGVSRLDVQISGDDHLRCAIQIEGINIGGALYNAQAVEMLTSSTPGYFELGRATDSIDSDQTTIVADSKVSSTFLSDFLTVLEAVTKFDDNNGSRIPEHVPLIDLGVDSIIATEIRAWFSREFGHPFSAAYILGGASATQLVHDAIANVNLPSTPCRSPSPLKSRCPGVLLATSARFERVEPLSFAQSRYWSTHITLKDPTSLNVSFYFHFAGSLDALCLRRAVEDVVNRHESLRTCFLTDPVDCDRPIQAVMHKSLFCLDQNIIAADSDEGVEPHFHAMKNHVYDMRNGDLMKILLLQAGPESNYLLIGYHHLTMDGFSFHQVFLPELERAYAGQALKWPSPHQLCDHTLSQREQVKEKTVQNDVAYWKTVFPDLPSPLPLFPMSMTKFRPALSSYHYNTAMIRLDATTTNRIRKLSAESTATAFHFHLTTLTSLLFRMLQATDICIGIADANRGNMPGDTSVIGMLLNFLPLRFHHDSLSQRTFAAALAATRAHVHEALSHSRVPFDVLLDELQVPRASTHTPLFQVFVNYRSRFAEKGTFADLVGHSHQTQITKAGYDLSLDIGEGPDGQTDMTFLGQAALLSEGDVGFLAKCYQTLLEDFLRLPQTQLNTCRMYDEQDCELALVAGRGKFGNLSGLLVEVRSADLCDLKVLFRILSGQRLLYTACMI